ncbi:MAG TPA: hypothetical protein VGC39_00235 [Candidatus Methylacidiphilales bacterium]
MNPEPKKNLNAILKEWQPQVDLPARFESEVWRRIALSQEKPAKWWNFDWLFALTLQPRLAYAVVLVAVFMGAGLASVRAEQNYHHAMATSESRYIHAVDPFSNVSRTSNL